MLRGTPGSMLKNHSEGLPEPGPPGVLAIKPGLAACKASVFPPFDLFGPCAFVPRRSDGRPFRNSSVNYSVHTHSPYAATNVSFRSELLSKGTDSVRGMKKPQTRNSPEKVPLFFLDLYLFWGVLSKQFLTDKSSNSFP